MTGMTGQKPKAVGRLVIERIRRSDGSAANFNTRNPKKMTI
jgi:hypothetical protein